MVFGCPARPLSAPHDDAGNQIPLVRGPIYVQVVPLGADVELG